MNILKTLLTRTIMVCTFCAFVVVSGYSSIIIEEDIMRVASNEKEVIEEVILVDKNSGERYTFVNKNGKDSCEFDVSELNNGCYDVVVVTRESVEKDSACKR